MGIVYFRRFRMEIDLTGPLFPQPATPFAGMMGGGGVEEHRCGP